ncbi:hypothetical protein GIB67_028725 [Kingdonia uniflora]|uniref:TFIIS N-terminal domain-containing protein n=1 Tax=Kingdonia uniflora TaxID=39325 RepID=A0A7J7N9X4_9MAGN|nr:hypothetical protein GIB67_028725 [Kingdonia uniflora]
MTSEDFLTLPEMKEGLTSLARVEELVSVMKRNKIVGVKSVNEAAKEWFTIASTLFATDDQDSLNHFIRMDGLFFLEWWLQEAHKISNDTTDCCLENSIALLLEVLKKFSIDDDGLRSGMRVTVMNLFSYKSFGVRKKARELFNSWLPDFVKDGKPISGFKTNNQTITTEDSTEDSRVVKPAQSECQHSRSSDCSQTKSVNDEEVPVSGIQDNCIATLTQVEKEGEREISQSSVEESLISGAEKRASISMGICSSPFPVVSGASGRSSEVPELKDLTNGDNDMGKRKDSPDKFGQKDLETPFLEEDNAAVDDLAEFSAESFLKLGGNGFAITNDFSEQKRDTKISEINSIRSDMEFDYGVDDALEVARQVAREVEREVVDYREQFCSSSSEENSGCGVVQPDSPDSMIGNRPQNEVLKEHNLSSRSSSQNMEEQLSSTETVKTLDCMNDTDTSHVTEAIQESSAYKTNRTFCDFDLNEDICSEEMPYQKSYPTAPHKSDPVIVSASKAASPGFPESPLCFKGERGWKGSAATSAFRPASPRKASNDERIFEFDLNVAEGEDVEATNQPVLVNQIPVSSDLPSGESSIEVSSRLAERVNLAFDLNHVGDKEDALSSDRGTKGHILYPHQNGNPSPASSSSSKQLSSVRNINLNDNPLLFDNSNDQRIVLRKHTSTDAELGVITIMGKKVEVNRRTESVAQTRSFFLNTQVSESPVAGGILARSDFDVGMRPMMSYMNAPPAYRYNDLAAESMSFPQAMYGSGSIPYMINSRGALMAPQMMCSPAGIRPSYPSEHYHLISMTPQMGGRSGTLRTVPDLNLGLTIVESENKDPGRFRQCFIPGQGMFMEEQARSEVGMKRQEPDGERDLNPYRYKH